MTQIFPQHEKTEFLLCQGSSHMKRGTRKDFASQKKKNSAHKVTCSASCALVKWHAPTQVCHVNTSVLWIEESNQIRGEHTFIHLLIHGTTNRLQQPTVTRALSPSWAEHGRVAWPFPSPGNDMMR